MRGGEEWSEISGKLFSIYTAAVTVNVIISRPVYTSRAPCSFLHTFLHRITAKNERQYKKKQKRRIKFPSIVRGAAYDEHTCASIDN